MAAARRSELSHWFEIVVADGASLELPGLYRWEIQGEGTYIGKYTNSRRPLREYALNVEKLEAGRPYRKNKPAGFRTIHRALHRAKADSRLVTLTILENPAPDQINARERELIKGLRPERCLNG